MEVDSPEGSYRPGYTPLSGGDQMEVHPPPPAASYQPLSYGTTDYPPVLFSPQDPDQSCASHAAAGYFHKTVMMCQQPAKRHTVMVNTVPDNMGMAVFTTLCCCWPLGLLAILRAQESRRALQQGDMLSASVFSTESRRFSLWAVAGGVSCLVVSIVIIIVIVRINYDY